MAGMLADGAAPLGDIHIPTLILWGDRDSIFARAEQDLLVASLAKANLKVYQRPVMRCTGASTTVRSRP